MTLEFAGAATPLAAADVVAEAKKLGVEAAAVWAVCDVESNGHGFLPDKRPQILFEAHQFHILTKGQWDRSHPNISSPEWNRALYGASGAHQYDRLAEAIALNRDAALQSTSWGMFQIMGANHAACGFKDAESFVAAMMIGEAAHLAAFGAFCQANGIVRFLGAHDWRTVALRYNGSGQVTHYAAALASAYVKRKAAA